MDTENIIDNNTTKPSVKQVFAHQDFLKLWIGQFISNSGSAISFIVLPLFIFAFTGSTFWLGVISIAEFIPVIFFSPVAGVFVDSHNRKTIMIASDLFNTLFILIIPVLIAFTTFIGKNYVLIGITLIVFLANTVNRFFMPAREASIPHLVNSEELGSAVSISQTTYQLIMIIGPIIGTLIVTVINFSFGFVVDGITFIISAIFVSFIKTNLKPTIEDQEKPNLLLGTKKIFQIKSLRFLIIIFSFLMFANSVFNAFLVAFAKSDLQMTNLQFGTAIGIFGAAGVVTGLILTSKISSIKRPTLVVAISFFLDGLFLLPILVIKQAWNLYIMFILIGPLNVFINIPVNIIFLRDTTDNIRGQVFSALNMLISVFNIIGLIYGVIIVHFIGIRLLFFSNSLIFLIVGFGSLFYLIFINNLDNPEIEQVINHDNVPISSD